MKIKNTVGRPKIKCKRARYNLSLLPSIRNAGDRIAFEQNMTLSRYIENLILDDVKQNRKKR